MPPRFLYPFLPYRSFIGPILVVSAVIVPSWLAYRVYRHRTRRPTLSLRREVLLLLFVVYLSAVAAATLTPNRSARLRAAGTGGIELTPNLGSLTCSAPAMPSGSTAQGFCQHNARGNVMLFFPLGILLPLVSGRIRFWRGLQIAIALSGGIELLQYVSSAWGSYRAADVNDVILNAVGAGLGLAAVSLVRLVRQRRRPDVVRA